MVEPNSDTDATPVSDHRSIRLTSDQRRDLLQRSDWRGAVRFGGHFGFIVAVAGLIAFEVPGWPVLMLPLGVAIIYLFTTLHEAVHRTPFKTVWINDAVAHLSGFLVTIPATWFRYLHFDHHRFTNDPAHDPELATPRPRTIGAYFYYLSGIPVWIGNAKVFWGNARHGSQDSFVPDHARGKTQREALIYLVLYGLIVVVSVGTGSLLVLWIWIVPILVGQPFLRAFLMSEHGGCPHVDYMLANSRTVYTNAIVRFFSWNMSYHAEHHAMPAIPFYRLADYHVITGPHLQATAEGYINVHRQLFRQLMESRAL